MKNKYRLLTLAILLLTFFGCQTEDIKSETETETIIENAEVETNSASYDFKVEVKNDMLSFATREDYDKAIEFLGPLDAEGFSKWEASLGFNSMRLVYTEQELLEKGITDDLVATLINPLGQIEIAGNVLMLDKLSETVTVISSDNYSKGANTTAKNKRVFSTEDEILDILEGTDSSITDRRRRFCKADSCCPSTFSGFSDIVKYKVVYQKFGFINSLQAKITKESFNTSQIWISMKTTGSNFYRKKRGGAINFTTSRSGTGRVYSYRPYYSSRRLKDYQYRVFFEAKNLHTTNTNYSSNTIGSYCSR